MIKIKPVLVNVVVMYSLMLGGMALSCFDAIERGVHLSAVYNFLVWILGGTLCVICICHTYKIDEKGVRQLILGEFIIMSICLDYSWFGEIVVIWYFILLITDSKHLLSVMQCVLSWIAAAAFTVIIFAHEMALW